MEKRNKICSNISGHGFSILEAMIFFALIGGAALIVMQLMTNQSKQSTTSLMKNDILSTLSEIQSILADKNSCVATLNGKKPSSVTTVDQVKKAQYNNLGVVTGYLDKYVKDVKAGNANIEIEELALLPSDPPDLHGAVMQIKFKKNEMSFSSKQVYQISIYLKNSSANVDNTNICYAFGQSGSVTTINPKDLCENYFGGVYDPTNPSKKCHIPVSVLSKCDVDENGIINADDQTAVVNTNLGLANYPKADVNRDGLVNALDVVAVTNCITKHTSVCDVNSDGRVNEVDVRAVINNILGIIPSYPKADLNSDGTKNALDAVEIINCLQNYWPP